MNDQASDHRDPSPEPGRHSAHEGRDAVSDEEMRKTLVLLHRLSNEAVERIDELMRSLHLRFSEAAVTTGVVTERQLEEALALIRQRALKQGRSIFEEVIQRGGGGSGPSLRTATSSPQRSDVVIWKGEPLHPGRQLLIAHDPGHPRSEQLRRLRQELMLRTNSRRGAAFFALLSPCAREGRSQLAAELAIAFAQLARRTLLVDADLRRPCQHEIFGASNEAGLAQALAADGPPNLCPVQNLPKLAVLTSGGQPPNPVELLHGPRFERMIAEWRRSFEYVVLDTPPTSEFSDGLAVATAAGNVLVLSRAKTTTFNALKEMCRDLEPTNSRILGAVINSF